MIIELIIKGSEIKLSIPPDVEAWSRYELSFNFDCWHIRVSVPVLSCRSEYVVLLESATDVLKTVFLKNGETDCKVEISRGKGYTYRSNEFSLNIEPIC